MEVTQDVTTDTFVIIEGNKQNDKLDGKSYSKKDIILDSNKNGITVSKQALETAILTTCLFQFDSPVLIPSESDKILSVLAKKNLKNTSLVVTGYTCSLGPKEYNQTLSLQAHGFVIATVGLIKHLG